MKNILMQSVTADYNDMHAMLSEIEQKLIGVDSLTQMRFYAGLQNRLYEMLYFDSEPDNILLFPQNSQFAPVCTN